MILIKRTLPSDIDFINLITKLDADLSERDGEDHSFFKQFNSTDSIHHAVVVYLSGQAAGCGALRKYDTDTIEIKRMYTIPTMRGQGVATAVLHELEKWAATLGFKRCILETGDKQPEAIQLYRKLGYKEIPNYGPYADVPSSVCFEKLI
jgi:putative acetyltransferase